MADLQLLYDEWDAAAVAMAAGAGIPPAALEVAAFPVQQHEGGAAEPPAVVLDVADVENFLLDEPQPAADEQPNVELDEPEPQPNVELDEPEPQPVHIVGELPIQAAETHCAEGSGAAPSLDLQLGRDARKRATYPKTYGPCFMKKIEQTHLNLPLVLIFGV